jgi:enoyl-CoA hydratase
VLVDPVADGVTRLTLNRPDRLNAITRELVDEVHAALDAVDADHDCRVVILTGAGRAFCAGADLNGVGDFPGTEQFGARSARWRCSSTSRRSFTTCERSANR